MSTDTRKILRDVLGYHVGEVATILKTVESVTSALKGARATLEAQLPRGESEPALAPRSDAERALVERFTTAFENRDLDGVARLLTDDVWFTMPPLPLEWQGKQKALAFLRAVTPEAGVGRRLLETRSNGQPALGMYFQDPSAPVLHLVGMLVLTVHGDQISAVTRFDHTALYGFDLPRAISREREGDARRRLRA